MYIVCSKKSDLLNKRIGKYFSKFLPEIEYIPRGKTNLKTLFDRAEYKGHDYFLLISGNSKESKLSVYKHTKQDSFMLETQYSLSILDLRHTITFREIEKNNQQVNDSKKIFYFLKSKYLSQRSDYGIFLLEEKPTDNIFEFRLKEKYLGFRFKLLNVKKFDK